MIWFAQIHYFVFYGYATYIIPHTNTYTSHCALIKANARVRRLCGLRSWCHAPGHCGTIGAPHRHQHNASNDDRDDTRQRPRPHVPAAQRGQRRLHFPVVAGVEHVWWSRGGPAAGGFRSGNRSVRSQITFSTQCTHTCTNHNLIALARWTKTRAMLTLAGRWGIVDVLLRCTLTRMYL